jgi:putative glutamine amidotransferase
MPRIAIGSCAKLHDYQEAVRRAGGDPLVVSADSHTPAAVVASADAVLLAGGSDVDPALYGEAPHPRFDAAEPGRDAFEIELVRLALEADLPVLAICRGIQLLNVARGGTLVQDIPDQVPNALEHRVPDPPFAIAHDAWVSSDSLLERTLRERLDGDTCAVNSRHHQAIKKVGDGLVVTATAPDGIIEAVEDPTKRFCLGVQWHPENFYRTGEFRELFEALVKAASRS